MAYEDIAITVNQSDIKQHKYLFAIGVHAFARWIRARHFKMTKFDVSYDGKCLTLDI